MSHTAAIDRENPTCFLFLVDQSGSMKDPIQDGSGTKADVVADAMNRLLQTLRYRCTRGEKVLDRYFIGVIGYGSTKEEGNKVGPALGGILADWTLVSISQLAEHPLRVEQRTKKQGDGAGGIVEMNVMFTVWLEPKASGKTPMRQALEMAHQIVSEFIKEQPGCFPPMVINITDGEATDATAAQLEQAAAAITSLQSEDGNVLLWNMHVTSSKSAPIQFPDGEAQLPDDFARLLFRMSSVLPPGMRKAAGGLGISTNEATRGFVFNADLVAIIQFLEIGTREDR